MSETRAKITLSTGLSIDVTANKYLELKEIFRAVINQDMLNRDFQNGCESTSVISNSQI